MKKTENNHPEINKIEILHYLLNKGNIYYIPENFDKEIFVNQLTVFLQTDLSLKSEFYNFEQINIVSYSSKKGVKSILGLSYGMNIVFVIDGQKLFYDFKPDKWLENPNKTESTINIKKLIRESKETEIENWIHSYLVGLSPEAESMLIGQNNYIQEISPKQKLWLSSNLNKGDVLLAFLEVSVIKKWDKEYEESKDIKWQFLLSTNEAKLIGFSKREEIIGFVDVKPGGIKVKKEMGRYPVTIGDIVFYTTRVNSTLYLDVVGLVSVSANERIREIARLNWLNRGKKTRQGINAIELMKNLTAKAPNPFDDLSILYMEYADGKKDVIFSDFVEDEKLLKLLNNILDYSGTIDLLTIWVEKWELSYFDILALNKLLVEAISDTTQAKNILPFHRLVRDKYQKKNKDDINAVIFDYEFAMHLIKCGQGDEAKKILNKRLKQLPDESISDLLPPKDLDLTGDAAGQMLKVKILEALSDLESGKIAIELTKQLAGLQPLVLNRIDQLTNFTDDEIADKASMLKSVMLPGGLVFEKSISASKKYNKLPDKIIEKNVRHPASRKDGSFSNIQKWLAKVDVPDYSMIKSYSEKLTEKKYPQLNEIVTDIRYALNIENLEVYISRGDKSVGISGFEGEPSYLIIGGHHLDNESVHYLGWAELKFAIAIEMAHLYFKHSRITSTDVWRGAIEKGYWVIDTAMAIIPIAGLFGKSIKGISKLNAISSILQKADKLDSVSKNSQGIISATNQAVELYNSKVSKEKDSDKEKQLLATTRVMQLTADRAALLFSTNLNASIRAMFLVSKRYYNELPVVEKYGLREFLLKKDDEGNFIHQDFAIRLANLFAFYISDEYNDLLKMLITSEN
ncbi:MAG: hypothetical protein B6I20_00455 [Bacteroidetes bacterium 4572_117]|nr:MAG: hypothetical protein B6I20_00455 [Bacteroidetes bacterium 4572_117]